ncbi:MULTISPECIES: hypothetical protein [unclassified Bradyrhizobium]|uniref:hypothetical protein n=1 Tax=unclassified Bradyrhizobium TaxID=2631580 RepID=UPI001BAD3594|nr:MULTISPECIES: hypothetical protein [unclassified Bradyrhizobium]MBR1153384.1 hypothetical protein [Bradyrhizobium sp. JYMT SZCCT0428]MBR1273015.1 hypothetical protein [Bradyrhizobium sp. AUGA SZCCT0222]
MTSNMPALDDHALDAVSGGLGKGDVCVGTTTMIKTSAGTLTLGAANCTAGGVTVSIPFGSWEPA